MPLDLITIGVLLVVFVSTLVRGVVGFGNALVAMPLLAVLVGMKVATALVALVALVVTGAMLAGSWRDVSLRSAWRLVGASLLGIPPGLLLLKNLPESAIKGALGAVVAGFALYSLFRPKLIPLRSETWAYAFGFVAGVLGGAYNVNGPPVVVYGALRDWSPGRFRATLQGYFLPTGLLIVAGHASAGLWTRDVLWLFLFSLPVAGAALLVGTRIGERVPEGRFDALVNVTLLVMGGMLLWSARASG